MGGKLSSSCAGEHENKKCVLLGQTNHSFIYLSSTFAIANMTLEDTMS